MHVSMLCSFELRVSLLCSVRVAVCEGVLCSVELLISQSVRVSVLCRVRLSCMVKRGGPHSRAWGPCWGRATTNEGGCHSKR